MNLIDLIREVRADKGDDFLCSDEFVEMLENIDSKEDAEFRFEAEDLVCLIRLGVMKEMLRWDEYSFYQQQVEHWIEVFYKTHRCHLKTPIYDMIQKVGIGIGKVAIMVTIRAAESPIMQGDAPDGDDRLEYLSNGEGDTNQGEVWLDTGVEVPTGSKLELWFADEVCDGPVAGYAYRKWPWSKEKRFELSLHKRRLFYNYKSNWEGNQTKVFRQNIYYAIAYNLKPSEHEQGIVRGCDCDRKPTVKLFRFANQYAWTGLKIYGFKVTDGSNDVIADMIPVMHRGKPCMYDKVRKKHLYLKEKEVILNPFR